MSRDRTDTGGSLASFSGGAVGSGSDPEWTPLGTSSSPQSPSRGSVEGQSQIVGWIQGRRLPKVLWRGNSQPPLLISGVDVVVAGKSSAAEVVRIAGVKPPRYLFYMLSGFLCGESKS